MSATDFAHRATRLQFDVIVLQSLTLGCSLVQLLAWRDVVERALATLLPDVHQGDTLLGAVLNAVG